LAAAPVAPRDPAEEPVRALIERGAEDMRANPEASRRDAEAALVELKRHPDPDLEVRARLLLCDYQSERDGAAAQEQIDLANAQLAQARRPGLRAGVLTCQGEMRETAGDNVQAQRLFEEAVVVATRAQDDEMLAEALFSRGYLLGLQGEYARGLTDLRRSQELFEKLAKPMHALTTLNSIAIIYNRMGDYVQAKHIYRQAIKAQSASGLANDEAVTLYNLGRVQENLSEWQDARQSFNESLTMSRQIGYARGQGYALRGLGAVATALGDARGALHTLSEADVVQRQTPDARLHAQIQLARGIALHRLKRLQDSHAALEDALKVFVSSGALSDLAQTDAELASVHADMGDWRTAFERERDYAQVSGKSLTNQIDQRFATLKVEFDTAARDKENALLMRQNEANQLALEQGRNVRRLQAEVIGLTVLLASVLATLALHQRARTLRMRALAMTDELTGVPNRRAVLTRLDELLARTEIAPCSILIMDIDHFKSINDHHGHPAGDEVLKAVAAQVRLAVGEPAFFGRLGGEEFLVVLPDTNLERAYHVGESFRQLVISIDTARWFPDRRRITASVGAAVSTPAGETIGTMLKRADNALYAAKRSGRNCVRCEPPIIVPSTRVPGPDLEGIEDAGSLVAELAAGSAKRA
jgi:diguanylate cyclase (GGDEF)-like protein